MTTDAATDYVRDHRDDFLDDLFELLEQPSISTTGEGVGECTDLAERLCETYGFDSTQTVETDGQPAIIAHADADEGADEKPTILLYGHYDVQPVDPDEWTTPPFEPTIRPGPDGRDRIYARGAGDNKGQWFAHLCAVRALRETTGLPMNVTLLLEGEEENGSPNLEAVVSEHADELAADLAYVADGPIDASGRPHVLMGARGMLYVQLDVTGPNRDLHSGNFGGPVPNPAWECVRLLSSMKDESGRVTIEGFYDDVRPITDLDREALEAMPFDADAVMDELEIGGFADGPGDSYLEKLLYYPTLNVAGFTSGYGGEGTKTILPSKAQVKMDMRLVADQDPDDIFEKFRDHVETHASDALSVEVTKHGTMDPQRTPLDHPVREPVLAAVADGWDDDPILKPTLGGSLPTAVFADHLDAPVVVVPYANSDEDNHSPDENLALWCFESGVRTTAALLARLADEEYGR
ncbi:M20/M25/M40 family metallo-hydrolase [Halorussus amylolyticus]|uniref:M20/M25/M40 family metallo-hydrolase n=1 Tax=Halorussus amylolyticus TaxID=1126242 RepID=UPI001EE3E225|nr:M20/M25/M40 family metallo-hydrolase [Halorussus amylolyticus]